jgi:putative phosphonate transport system ATP-binding protein
MTPVVSVRDLEVRYANGTIGCSGVCLDVLPGEIVGLVGESGSGKSSVLGALALVLSPMKGTARFGSPGRGSVELFGLNPQDRRWLRQREIGLVHQNPRMILNFDLSAGANIAEALLTADWRHVGRIRRRAGELLARVEMDLSRMDDLPGRLSGGEQQRVQLARALANSPVLLLLDEPTGGLDVSVQARLLDLIRELSRDLGMAMLLVSHDLEVVRLLARRTLVMRRGCVVESGLTDQILEDPQQPYTQHLVHCRLGQS